MATATWMLVEDEPDLYDMMLAMYSTLGVDGLSFVTGEDAVDWIDEIDSGQIEGELPELALLDIRLPDDISGIEVGARIRQSPMIGHIPIALMTAYKMSPTEERAAMRKAGASLLMRKPLPSHKELAKMLRGMLNGRSSGGAAR